MKIDELRKELLQDPDYVEAERELEPYLTLADNVLRFRIKKGWTQSELARRANTKQANISRLESGLSNPTLKFIIKLSNALEIDLYELMVNRDTQHESSGTDVRYVPIEIPMPVYPDYQFVSQAGSITLDRVTL